MLLQNKIAIITGAGRGIGKALALRFASEGASVAITARSEEELASTVAEITQSGGVAFGVSGDVSNPQDVEALYKTTLSRFGTVDILINNAGIQGDIGLLNEVGQESWMSVVSVNLFGTYLCMHAVLPTMMKNRKGKIINMSGGGATSPRIRFSAYAASKTAIVRLTETAAEEMKDFGIDINAIAPGAINTRMTEEVVHAGMRSGENELREATERLAQSSHTPERAVELCVFLASSASNGITGKLISAPWDPWSNEDFIDQLRQDKDIATLRRIDNKTFFKKS